MGRFHRPLVLFLALALPNPLAPPHAVSSRAGELDKAREDVRNPKQTDVDADESRRKRSPKPVERCGVPSSLEQDDDDVWLNSDGLLPVGYLVATPFWLPHKALGDSFYDHGYVVAAPYEDAPAALISNADPEVRLPPVFGRLQWDTLTDFGDLWRGGGSVLLESPKRFGLDASFGYWRERLPDETDEFWLGDFNLVYRFAQSSKAQFRAGLGANWLADTKGVDVGVNFTYGFDLFPVKPWVISQTIDLGTLGGAGLIHSQTTVGLVHRRWEFFTGFDCTRLGRSDLYGWLNGVRVRF